MENNNRRALRLPEFWVRDPVAWFAHVEAHFELENLTSQQHRYFNMVKSLSQASLRLIKDILANPHPTTPYNILKDRLLNNHSLTDFQKIKRQFKIGELGPQQKPSELLAVWPFLLAKVQFPIIGVDFLRHFKLLVDPAANPLVDTSPPSFCLQYPACAASPNQPRPWRWPLPHLSGVPPHHRYTLRIQPLPLSLVAARAASPPGL
jgi:hypothetical protein